jgi:hypothetical protein
MQTGKVFLGMAWGERECSFHSAKWSAAMVVATFAALLIFCGSLLYGAQQTDFQRAMQARAAQTRTTQAQVPEILSRDWKDWTALDCEAVLKYSVWGERSGSNIQLRSALPIREALLRQLQFKKQYDKMSPTQKLAFDKKNPPEIVESESDPVLLFVEHDATYDDFGEIAADPPQQAALELRNGTLVMPTKTEALQDDQDGNRIVYSFPRVIDGDHVLATGDQNLRFVFGKPLVPGGRIRPLQNPRKFKIHELKFVSVPGTKQKLPLADGQLTRISFPTAGLMYNGKLEY